MEIKTTGRPRETTNTRSAAAESRHAHKKATNKLGKGHIAGRRLFAALKMLGKLGAFVLLVGCLLLIYWYAYSSDKFNLRTVTIHGCKEIEPESLETVVRQNCPANILEIDLHKLRRRLEKEPWVKRVEIRRILPSELILYVQERVPSAIVEFRSELMIADHEGIILDRYEPEYGKLDVPVFKGLVGEDDESNRLHQEENSGRIRKGLQMLAEIESGSPRATKKISEVDISDPENLKLLLVGDTVEVFMGEKDYLKRFNILLSYYENLKNQYTEIESIDLRVSGKLIYAPRRASAADAANNTKT